MPKQAKSLDEFAATMPQARKAAWITLLPEWVEISTAYRNGIGPRVIYEWLKQEKGYEDGALRDYSNFRKALYEHAARA